ERVVNFTGNANVLKDEFTNKLIEKEVSVNSVITLLDADGNVLNIHEDHGQKFDGWWASNTYSFNDAHREVKTGSQWQSWNDYIHEYNDDDGRAYGGDTAASNVCSISSTTTSGASTTLPKAANLPTIIKPGDPDPEINPALNTAADRITLALQMTD